MNRPDSFLPDWLAHQANSLPGHLAVQCGQVSAQIAQVGEVDALHTQREGEFTAMMDVGGHDAPENPTDRTCVSL